MDHLQCQTEASSWKRIAIIGIVLCGVIGAHWVTPISTHGWHSVHLTLRLLLIIPVVLAAIWFNLRGALIVTAATTLLYLPHIVIQWVGRIDENMNQLAVLILLWFIAVLTGNLVAKEKNVLRQVAETHEGAVIALISALDAREHDTELHSLRVRDYALRLGRDLALGAYELKVLGQAALLHDVGKIGVPDNVLLKPGPLTDEEWDLMRAHVIIGKQILQPVPFLQDAAEIVYCHHEKFDGSGYPRGLRGEEIPLGARIFALVDAYDAIVSKRSYKNELAPALARERIIADAGRAFDPNIVKAFLAIAQEEWQQAAMYLRSAEDGSNLREDHLTSRV